MNQFPNMQQLMALGALGGQPRGPPALVEFKAGRMNFDGRMVTADRRKGMIKIVVD